LVEKRKRKRKKETPHLIRPCNLQHRFPRHFPVHRSRSVEAFCFLLFSLSSRRE
jgi:hypothetical protein